MATRESTIEKKVCDYARKNGWLVFKFTSPGNRSVPDRLFIKSGIHVFIEFKAEGKKPSKLQDKTMKDMQRQGCKVHVVDNADWGKTIINVYDREIREKKIIEYNTPTNLLYRNEEIEKQINLHKKFL